MFCNSWSVGLEQLQDLGSEGTWKNESKTEFTESKACSRPGAKDLELNKVNFWTSYCSDDPYLEAKIGKDSKSPLQILGS